MVVPYGIVRVDSNVRFFSCIVIDFESLISNVILRSFAFYLSALDFWGVSKAFITYWELGLLVTVFSAARLVVGAGVTGRVPVVFLTTSTVFFRG